MSPAKVKPLVQLLAYRAAETPDKIAFIFDGQPVSYREMGAGVDRFGAYLMQQGIQRGDRVLLTIPNSSEFFPAFYGIQRAGGIAVPIFPGSGPERTLGIANLCGATAIVVPSSTPAERLAEIENLSTDRRTRLLTVSESSGSQPNADLPPIHPDDVAFIQYTSGSTGNPKGVQLSHANLITNIRQMIAGMRITPDEVFCSWLPVYHDMGLILKTMVPFYLGTGFILLPTSLADTHPWLDAIQQHRATFTAAPDFAYRLCLRYTENPGAYDLSSLRVALNAAEPVRAQTISDFDRAFGLRNVMVAGYGLAEATVGVSMWPPGTPAKADERGFVSIGRTFPGIDLKIAEGDRVLGAGRIGEMVVSSPANTRGYYRNPEESARLFWREGYIRTGDLGYYDQDGDLFIVGRKKNIIIHAGRNIAPQEVEEIVDALPFVRYSAALGVDRGRTEGEQVYVFAEVRAETSASQGELQDMVLEIVHAFHTQLGFRPGRVYLLKPRAIPMTHNGKIQHARLKESYLNGSLQSADRILFPGY